MPVFMGTAGWSIPRAVADRLPTLLNDMRQFFRSPKINSSFHRPHRIATWERRRNSAPEDFRFSVKLPKQVTHVRELIEPENQLTTEVRSQPLVCFRRTADDWPCYGASTITYLARSGLDPSTHKCAVLRTADTVKARSAK